MSDSTFDRESVSEVVRSPARPYGKGWYEDKPGIWRREFAQAVGAQGNGSQIVIDAAPIRICEAPLSEREL